MNNYIITSDVYSLLLEGYIELFNKYCKKNVKHNIVLGFEEPKVSFPQNFSFHSLGNQKDATLWTEPLIKFFENIDDDYFLLCFEDHYLLKEVNHERLEEGIKYMKEGRVDKLYLQPDYSHKITHHYKGNWFVSATCPHALTTTSLMPCIWKREYFLKLLRLANNVGCANPHQFEIINNFKSFPGNVILLTKDITIYANLDAVRKGQFNNSIFQHFEKNGSGGDRSWMQNLDPQDIEVFKKMRVKWESK